MGGYKERWEEITKEQKTIEVMRKEEGQNKDERTKGGWGKMRCSWERKGGYLAQTKGTFIPIIPMYSQCRWTWGDASGVCDHCDSSCRSLLLQGSGPPAPWAARQKPSHCSVTKLQHSGSWCSHCPLQKERGRRTQLKYSFEIYSILSSRQTFVFVPLSTKAMRGVSFRCIF